MEELMAVTKALADQNRVRLLAALEGRELCVCQLIDLIGLAPSTVSKHLFILRSARLVKGRKDGRWMHYRLADGQAPPEAATALTWLLDAVRENPVIMSDRLRLERMLNETTEASCSGAKERQAG